MPTPSGPPTTMPRMAAPHERSGVVAARLAQASERLRARHAPTTPTDAEASGSLTAAEALVLLHDACDGLAATELEVRRARAELVRLAAQAAARGAPLDAA